MTGRDNASKRKYFPCLYGVRTRINIICRLEELKNLNDQRKILLPDNMPPSPPPEREKSADDSKLTDAPPSPTDTRATEDEEDDANPRRGGLRRARDRAAEREKKRQKEAERKKEAEAAKVPKQSKQFLKVLKDIRQKEDLIKKCEEEIAVLDNDIREADCPRTRVLGKDRFWNRYYWFERNGMPYGGLPDSSTAHAEYANGCIWVQGPDDLEREGYIDLPTEFQNEYKARFNMTVPERKEREEGETSVFSARQWGYFSEPGEVEALLEYLDPRGFNELKLRKEIISYKERIVKGMESRKAYLEPAGEKEEEEGKRVSTRKKVKAEEMARCMNWSNGTAMEELGHLHVEEPPLPRSRAKAKKRSSGAGGEPPAKKGKK